jgi:hypothetical protein
MIRMSLVDDLRQAAFDAAAIAITQSLTGNGGTDPERLAKAAVEAAAPFLEDARRVDGALAAREPQQPRFHPHLLWEEAAGDEHRYLELMEEYGWLSLTTCQVAESP